MTNTELVHTGIALGLAQAGRWNDCWDALTLAPRELFERVEGFCAATSRQDCRSQEQAIQSWLAEQGVVLGSTEYDITGQFGPTPWTYQL